MPIVEYPEFTKYEQFKGVFVGGCVERGDGSSFRRKAHAHTAYRNSNNALAGWICVRSAKRLRNAKGEPSLLMWHELAHLISNQGHTAKFEKTMRELCGRSDVVSYRKRIKQARATKREPYPVLGMSCAECGASRFSPCDIGNGRYSKTMSHPARIEAWRAVAL